MTSKLKPEVQQLLIEFAEESVGSKRWYEILEILTEKYKFTIKNILGLMGNHPVIEYNADNKELVLENET